MPLSQQVLALTLLAATASAALPMGATAADDTLHAYESCHFDDGLQVVKVDHLPPGVQQRSVDTRNGPRPIRMLDGRRIMLAYARGEFVANVKPELLPADVWGLQKQTLLDELAYLLAEDHGNVPAAGIAEQMQGLEVHGFDRASLTGNVLGFYLLFDNTRHIATSVYLLNQSPLTRSFQTIEQYRELRTRVLTGYAACVAQNQSIEHVTAKEAH